VALDFATAMHNLAVMYSKGLGPEEEATDEAAFGLYERAASKGDIDAMVNMGVMCADGRGTLRNERRACELYSVAADSDDICGLFNLGLMYQHGKGVPLDEEKAFSLFLRAASLGDGDSQCKVRR